MRVAQSLTGAQVAGQFGWSESKVSRIESGKSPLSDKDAKDLLAAYGVADQKEVQQFVGLVRRSRQPGWWHSYGDTLPDWFKAYVGFESDASAIRTYQTELVPGLLQSEEYAREVIRAMNTEDSVEEIERRASLRIQRQEIFDRPVPPKFWTVLNESVLRRLVGSAKVMADQLDHVANLVEAHPTVTVQILPFDAGAHASMGYSFSVMSFEDVPGSIAYAEALTSATYMEKAPDVNRHDEIFQRLMAASTRPDRSIAWLRDTAREYKA
jgi:transcriptional regulator with XRE-family HTH domain